MYKYFLKINIKDVYYVYDNVRILDSLKRLNTINKYNIHYSLGSVRLFNEINNFNQQKWQ